LDLKERDKPFEFNGFELSQSREVIAGNFNDKSFVEQIGKLATQEFNFPFFWNSHLTADDTDISHQSFLSETYIESLNLFVMFLWFIKDNSVNTSNLLTYLPSRTYTFTKFKNNLYSNATGKYEMTSFSYDELMETSKIFDIYTKYSTGEYIERQSLNNIDPGAFNFKAYNKNNRIERVINFLIIARTKSFLPLRIAFYMTVFESLFTTDFSELSHKIAERTALYVSGSPEVKMKNYNVVKRAYDVRSKYFHGQVLAKNKDDINNLIQLSTDIDSLLRTILKKVLIEDSELFLGNNLQLFLDELIFQRS
jgi:hypothetical protein